MTTDMPVYTRGALRAWIKNLWDFMRECNRPGNLEPLPSYVWIAFTNPEMVHRMGEERDVAVFVIGRCVEALIVNKLAANINSRSVPVNYDELACLSTILGTKSNDVELLLLHPGAIEFTNTVFLTWAYIDHYDNNRVPSDVQGVVQETFSILCQALPAELNAAMPQDQTDTLTITSEGLHELVHSPVSICLTMHYRDPNVFTSHSCKVSERLP